MRRTTGRFLALVASFWVAQSSSAVITNLSTGSGRNTTPPPSGAALTAWNLQGEFGKYLGTPISPSHFITAQHFDPSGGQLHPFLFRGTTYGLDTAFGTNGFVNVPGTDLRIWKVSGTFPGHAQINSEIGTTTAYENNKNAILFGRGTQRGAPILTVGTQRGWYHGPHDNGASSVMSWGENRINGVVSQGTYGETLFYNFTIPGGSSEQNEGTLSDGDSGGGLFITDANTGIPELAAINLGIEGPFSLSPTGSNPFFGAVYDRSTLFARDANGNWVSAGIGGANAFSTRIAPRAQFIYNTVQNASLNQRAFTATSGSYSFGNVNVSLNLTLNAATSLVANHVRGGHLTVNANANLALRRDGTDAGVGNLTGVLTLDPSATIDLSDNALIVGDTQYSVLRNLVKNARNNGTAGLWTGKGITSSAARDNPLYGLAILSNDLTPAGPPIMSSYKGQTVPASDVIIAYVLNGDSNLNGMIDADDYARIDRGFLEQNTDARKREYRWGDFNYDGMVTAADYALIDASFFAQNPSATGTPSSFSVLPEPGLATVALLGAATLLRRRRRA